MQQELIDLTPPELWDDIDMPNETLMESLIPILESAVKKIERQYPELDSVPKSSFEEKYPKLEKAPKDLIQKLLSYQYLEQAISSISGKLKYFHEKEKVMIWINYLNF